MAQKKPPQPPHPDDIPPVFADSFSDEAGGSSPSRIEVYRVSPNGTALIGEPPLDATHADLNDFVRTEDKAYGRKGGTYDARLKNAAGQFVKRFRFRVDRDPELVDASAAPTTPGLDPTFGAIGTMVTMMEAQARSYEQRVRADMAARELAAKIDAERRERDYQQQQQRERAYYDQQRERDRELSDQARERDRGMFSFLLEAGKNKGGDAGDSLKTLMAGIALAQELGGEGGGKSNFGDSILEKLGGKMISRFTGNGEEDDPEANARAAERAKPAAAAPPKPAATKDRRGGKAAPPPEEDEDDEGRAIIEMIETLLLNVDADAAATVITSLVKNGKMTRQVVSELAAGKLDSYLDYEKEVLDKLHQAAETAYRATAPRPVKATQ